jgi:hypothetical protein
MSHRIYLPTRSHDSNSQHSGTCGTLIRPILNFGWGSTSTETLRPWGRFERTSCRRRMLAIANRPPTLPSAQMSRSEEGMAAYLQDVNIKLRLTEGACLHVSAASMPACIPIDRF